MEIQIDNIYEICKDLGMEFMSENKQKYSLYEQFTVKGHFGNEFITSYIELCHMKFNMINYIYA